MIPGQVNAPLLDGVNTKTSIEPLEEKACSAQNTYEKTHLTGGVCISSFIIVKLLVCLLSLSLTIQRFISRFRKKELYTFLA